MADSTQPEQQKFADPAQVKIFWPRPITTVIINTLLDMLLEVYKISKIEFIKGLFNFSFMMMR